MHNKYYINSVFYEDIEANLASSYMYIYKNLEFLQLKKSV